MDHSNATAADHDMAGPRLVFADWRQRRHKGGSAIPAVLAPDGFAIDSLNPAEKKAGRTKSH